MYIKFVKRTPVSGVFPTQKKVRLAAPSQRMRGGDIRRRVESTCQASRHMIGT